MNKKRSILIVALAILSLATVVAISNSDAEAFPSYATATGQPCGTCHVNPAGGGPLTAAGDYYLANGVLPPATTTTTVPASTTTTVPASTTTTTARATTTTTVRATTTTTVGATTTTTARPTTTTTIGSTTTTLGSGTTTSTLRHEREHRHRRPTTTTTVDDDDDDPAGDRWTSLRSATQDDLGVLAHALGRLFHIS